MTELNLIDLELIIGCNFNNKALLCQALTHRSYLNENPSCVISDNERLEYLGDAVLDFVVAELLYQRFPEMREGELTRLRAALVREQTLAHFANAWQLGQFLFIGRGEATSGGRTRPTTLCAVFEAVIGALYLDQGIEAVRVVVRRLFVSEAERLVQEDLLTDAKSRLQEFTQGELQLVPVYRIVAENGPDHAKEFSVEVLVGKEVYGRGVGRSKQTAEQAAAAMALSRLTSTESDAELY